MTKLIASGLGASVPVKRDLYGVGDIPPLGHVPSQMHAWTIRPDRHGPPEKAMQIEVVPTPENLSANEVLVMVMAAGVNYNGIWAALGKPVSPFKNFHDKPYHIVGSDASGVVWAVGSEVKRWKVGDEVVVHCNQDNGDDEHCNGGDPMLSPSQKIWGYETPDGAFAQFTRVQDRQLMNRPKHLTWEESGCYMLTLATAYRMLFGHQGHELRAGQTALVWGAAGGVGSMAVQLANLTGADAVGVVSDSAEKRDFVLSLGAKGTINRNDFDCWGQLPDIENTENYTTYLKKCREFGKAIWEITGKGNNVDIVLEHPGEQTFPVSCFVAKRGGMIVFCAGTTGYNLSFDARFVWMHQKRIQGSHFATLWQASQANDLVLKGKINPCMSEVFPWLQLPGAHTQMMENKHAPGNMAVLVQAPRVGLTSINFG